MRTRVGRQLHGGTGGSGNRKVRKSCLKRGTVTPRCWAALAERRRVQELLNARGACFRRAGEDVRGPIRRADSNPPVGRHGQGMIPKEMSFSLKPTLRPESYGQ
jgi:hypothetical protein